MILLLFLHAIKGYLGYPIPDYNFQWPNFIKGGLFALTLNSILFAGFLIQIYWRIEYLSIFRKPLSLIIKENLYGPILEEIIYRAIIFNILKTGGFSNQVSCYISSFLFGICI